MAGTTELAKLLIKLGVSSEELERGLRDAEGKTQRSTQRMGGFLKGFARGVADEFTAVGGAVGALSQGLTALATGQGGAAAVVSIFKESVLAASALESSWAGVLKTVNATPKQFEALSGALKGLSLQIPISLTDLHGIAEAAGQLGVESGAIAEFSATMAKMAVTTDLSADQAATSFAQLANVMKIPQDQFDNMASTVVALGNAGASTESQIVAMALRLSGVGNQIGMTAQEVLAVSSSLADVGLSAELAGGNISKTLVEMNSAVIAGGAQLEKFAAVAGMSADAFASKFRNNAGAALQAFLSGLNKTAKEGKDVAVVLDDLGLTGQEIGSVLARAAGNADGMATALGASNKAWSENVALSDEAKKRFETLESKWTLFKNSVTLLAAELGGKLVPALSKVVELLAAGANLATVFIGGTAAPTVPGALPVKTNARGGFANSPRMGIWGEDGGEFLIPVGAKHKPEGMSLWLQAGRALGVPMAAEGGFYGSLPAGDPTAELQAAVAAMTLASSVSSTANANMTRNAVMQGVEQGFERVMGELVTFMKLASQGTDFLKGTDPSKYMSRGLSPSKSGGAAPAAAAAESLDALSEAADNAWESFTGLDTIEWEKPKEGVKTFADLVDIWDRKLEAQIAAWEKHETAEVERQEAMAAADEAEYASAEAADALGEVFEGLSAEAMQAEVDLAAYGENLKGTFHDLAGQTLTNVQMFDDLTEGVMLLKGSLHVADEAWAQLTPHIKDAGGMFAASMRDITFMMQSVSGAGVIEALKTIQDHQVGELQRMASLEKQLQGMSWLEANFGAAGDSIGQTGEATSYAFQLLALEAQRSAEAQAQMRSFEVEAISASSDALVSFAGAAVGASSRLVGGTPPELAGGMYPGGWGTPPNESDRRSMYDIGAGASRYDIPSFGGGGWVKETGPIFAHKGEFVETPSGGGRGGSFVPINITLKLNGDVLARHAERARLERQNRTTRG